MKKIFKMLIKTVIFITCIIAIIYLVGEPEVFTFGNVLLKFVSLFYLYLIYKINEIKERRFA